MIASGVLDPNGYHRGQPPAEGMYIHHDGIPTCRYCLGTTFILEDTILLPHHTSKGFGIYRCLQCGARYYHGEGYYTEDFSKYIPEDYEPPEEREKRELMERIAQLEERISRLESIIKRGTPARQEEHHSRDVIELPSIMTV